MPDTESPRSRWTPEVVIGLLVLLASLVLPYLDVPPGVSTACGLFAAWLLGPLPSPLTPRQPPDQRGHARGSLLVALLALGLGLLGAALLVSSAGCGSTYQARERAIIDWWPGPPCRLEVRLDDPTSEPVVTVDAPQACEPAPTQTPAPEPTP